MTTEDLVTDWQKLLASLQTAKSYREVSLEAGVGRDVIYRLAAGTLAEPRHSDGEKILSYAARILGFRTDILV